MTRLGKAASAAVLGLAIAAGATAPSYAHGDVRRIRIFYSDANHFNETGRYILYCDGHTNMVGWPDAFEAYENYTCP